MAGASPLTILGRTVDRESPPSVPQSPSRALVQAAETHRLAIAGMPRRNTRDAAPPLSRGVL